MKIIMNYFGIGFICGFIVFVATYLYMSSCHTKNLMLDTLSNEQLCISNSVNTISAAWTGCTGSTNAPDVSNLTNVTKIIFIDNLGRTWSAPTRVTKDK